jgi:hypothetical protein
MPQSPTLNIKQSLLFEFLKNAKNQEVGIFD